MAEALTAFLSIPDPLGDETEEAIEEAFDELDWKLSGIGEVVGWDADIEGVQLHLLAEEPRRVMPLLIEAPARTRCAATLETRGDGSGDRRNLVRAVSPLSWLLPR